MEDLFYDGNDRDEKNEGSKSEEGDDVQPSDVYPSRRNARAIKNFFISLCTKGATVVDSRYPVMRTEITAISDCNVANGQRRKGRISIGVQT